MKRYFLHILLVGILGMLAVSCSDEYDSMGLDSRKAQVVFSVAMDTPVSRSRAAGDKNTWGSDYAPSNAGDAYDNRIDINQFIVKIVDGEKEYKIKDIIKWKVDGSENVYKFVGVVDGMDQSTVSDPKVYVYANMGTTTPAETFIRQDGANIPMWGVKSIKGNLTFAPGTRVDLEEIALLRAMAKLEVSLNTEMAKEFALTGATLNKHNSEGYTLPMLPEAFDGSTEDLDLEGVMHPIKDETQEPLELGTFVTDTSYVVYLPEVENDDLQVTVKLKQKKVDENGTVTYGQEQEGTFSLSSDVVRNHWYKYTITGFAASEIEVSYKTVPWTNVNITVGGEGFLFLNKDLVEMYSTNIDADQLKFSSSTPIISIELKDIYKHYNNGNIMVNADAINYEKENGLLTDDAQFEKDAVYAYYISKYGQKIQLGTHPGFDIEGQEDILANEVNVLKAISATAQDGLSGGITINSPYIGDGTLGDSHNDTPRYLEFLVTNADSLQATFRVIQYPPVVITNTEGYFSYREDFRIDIPYEFKASQFKGTYTQREPYDNGEAIHYLNPIPPFFCLAGFFPYHIHKWDNEKGQVMVSYGKYGGNAANKGNGKGCAVYDDNGDKLGDYISFDETPAGLYERDHMRLDEYKGAPVTAVFHRTHYYWSDGKDFVGGNIDKPSNYYQNVSPPFYEIEDKQVTNLETEEVTIEKDTVYYVRHYTGNSFNFFYSKFVDHVYTENSTNVNGLDRYKGEADICSQLPNDEYNGWDIWAVQNANRNHRMYHIRTTAYSPTYTLGWPAMENKGGRMYTAEGEDNARMVSPSFMIASQLGTTNVPQNRDHYTVPQAEGMYTFAQRQCEQYAEAYYTDENGNGEYDPGELVTHYKDWRLPTRAEIELIVNYQRKSRAMDKVLYGEKYFHASTVPGDYATDNTLYNLDKALDNWTTSGYQMRCVRDVKPGQNGETKRYPLNANN